MMLVKFKKKLSRQGNGHQNDIKFKFYDQKHLLIVAIRKKKFEFYEKNNSRVLYIILWCDWLESTTHSN